MRNKKVKDMAIYALFIALISISTFTPIGYVGVPPTTFTLIHVFVLIMAFITDRKGGLIGGLTFGILSMIRAYVAPASPSDILFTNPIVSVLPRALFGLFAGYASEYLNNKFGKNLVYKTGIMVAFSVILTLAHSLLVLPMMYLFAPTFDAFKNFWNESSFFAFIGSVLVANSLVEMALAGVITPIVAIPIKKVLERN